MSFSYPVMLDLRRRSMVVFGGGAVAVRKVRSLIAAGADFVAVVSPDFHADLPDNVKWITDVYRERYLDGVDLVFAATNSKDVNDAIVRDCQIRHLWVNRADTDEDLTGDFVTPAQFRKGAVTVTVSAGSAALTAAIRDGLSDHWDDRWTLMAEAMRELRPAIVGAAHVSPERRSEILRQLASPEALERMTRDGVDGLKAWVRDMIAK